MAEEEHQQRPEQESLNISVGTESGAGPASLPSSSRTNGSTSTAVRSRKACLACRNIKVRCQEPDPALTLVPAVAGGEHACRRCARLKIPCTYDADKRSQRPSRASQSRNTPMNTIPVQTTPTSVTSGQLQSFVSSTIPGNSHHAQSDINMASHPDSLDVTSRPAQQAVPQLVQPVQSASYMSPGLSSGDRGHDTAGTLQHILGNLQTSPGPTSRAHRSAADYPTLAAAVDAASTNESRRARDTDPDPVTMSILTLSEATFLVENFHVKLGPYLNMFDPSIVTASTLQQTSAVLFSAVLSTAAKFYRQDIYKPLLQHAKQLVTRRLLAARYDVSLLQALLLLAHWREVADASAFVNIGTAIRLGYQLELHTSHTTSLRGIFSGPDTYREMDRQRTWFQLICYDSAYRLRNQNSLSPAMIPLESLPPDAAVWLTDTSNASDRQLVFSVELTRVARIIEAGLSSDNASVSALNYFHSLLERFRVRWLDGSVQWDPVRLAKCQWAYWYTVFKLHMTTATNQRFEHNLAGLLTALESAVSAALQLFTLDMLDYLPDSNAFQFLFIGERLSMLHEMLQPDLRPQLYQWMQEIYNAANAAVATSRGDGLPSTFVARYYHILLQEIQKPGSRQPTRPPSRAQSPAALMALDLGNAADLSNNVSAWINGWDLLGNPNGFETDYASLRQAFAQDLNWTDLLTLPS